MNLRKYCAENNLPYPRTWYRINILGMTLENAAKLPSQRFKHLVGTETLYDYCKRTGRHYSNVIRHMTENNVTAEEAVKRMRRRAVRSDDPAR